jgi:beta-glucosidase
MGSYNRVNGEYVCQREGLLSVPKREWGWPGFVVPDFIFAVRDDLAAALAGVDIGALDGPGRRTADDFTSGRIPTDRLDDMVTRILYGMVAGGLVDHPLPAEPDTAPSTSTSPAGWPPMRWCCWSTATEPCPCGPRRG